MIYQSKSQLLDLLSRLVEVPSVTGSYGELAMAEMISRTLSALPYFQKNPDGIRVLPTTDGRKYVTAFVPHPTSKKTIVLLSHFDVVEVEDFGEFKPLAFNIKTLTDEFKKERKQLPKEVQDDLETGDWHFGRGSMDMKAGIALQHHLIEKAAHGEFDGNVLMLSVPDEEANSIGMLSAVHELKRLKEEEGLEYVACLNLEPMFQAVPGDQNRYLYTGSVGKVLPAFFCLGKETHVGEPFAGLNANLMISEITNQLELNGLFSEKDGKERTPPPSNLQQKDLKEHYSVQTPHSAVAMFNLFLMKKPIKEYTHLLLDLANSAMKKVSEVHYSRALEWFDTPKRVNINVYTYQELLEYACEKFGTEEVERRQQYLASQRRDEGDRDFSTKMVQDLAFLCKEKGPMVILFYAPPYYPAVESHQNPLIRSVVQSFKDEMQSTFQVQVEEQGYFNGLSDLSFVQLKEQESSLQSLTRNLPLLDKGFTLPLDVIRSLNIPVVNMGPLGRDPHQWTERLEANYSFEQLPVVLSKVLNKFF